MHVEYENTIDDLLAFCKFAYARSPTIRIQRRLGVVIVALYAVWLSLTIESDFALTARLILAAFSSVGLGLVCYLLIDRAAVWQTKRMYREGKTEGLLGSHKLTIGDDSLVETTSVNETRVQWSGIDEVAETDTHAFIFVSALQAHIIPRHQLAVADYEAFIGEVQRRTQEDPDPSHS